jgi:uncharacterized membrane protein YeiH
MNATALDFLHDAIPVLQRFLWPDATEFTIPVYFDYFATFTWAVSGALVGAHRRYDLVGVFVIALVSAVGGGLLRDGVLLHRTPAFLTNGTYLLLVAAATAAIAIGTQERVWRPKWATLVKLVEWIDVVGVPAYAVVGMQLAQAQGLSTAGVVLVGVLNGVGGGVLRDVLVNDPPHLLLPGQYTTLVLLLACITFVVLTRWSGIAATPAGLAAMFLFFVIRAFTIRFNWQTRALLSESPPQS